MAIDILIKNGRIVNPTGILEADIAINEQKIVGIGYSKTFGNADEVINARGNYVIPGGIDPHTHYELEFMGEQGPEDWHMGTTAAAYGGTTTIIDFAIQDKGRPLMESIKMDVARAESLAAIDICMHGCFTDFTDPDKIVEEMPEVVEFGIPSIKEFMIYRKQGWLIDDWTLYRVLRKASELNALVGVHAESGVLGEEMIQKLVDEGKNGAEYHPISKPNFVEEEAIQRAISIARFAESSLYIVHMSTKEGVELVDDARRKGLPVWSETCTHYLTLTDEVYERPDGINYILSPPLRKKEDVSSLWKGLADGSVSVVGTDHVAFSSEQKIRNSATFATVPNGAGGVEVRLPLLLSEGVNGGLLSFEKMVEVFSTNAAKMFGLYPKKGIIAPGSDADIVIVDLEMEKTLSVDTLHMGPDFSMYEGFEVKGYPVTTLSKGKIIIDEENYLGQKGDGSFIKRKLDPEIMAKA
jgi:dihydropyrimidinase